MKLIIDAVTVSSPGMLNLKQSLVAAIAATRGPGDQVIVLESQRDPLADPRPGIHVERVLPPRFGWLGRTFWYRRRLPSLVRGLTGDVLYSLSGVVSVQMKRTVPVVSTINNMLPFLPSGLFYRFRAKERLRLMILKRLYIKSVQRSDFLVLHSEFARKKLSRYCDQLESKSIVVHTGVHSKMMANPSIDKGPIGGNDYIFYLSAVYPYKNQITLIRAYDEAKKIRPTLPDLILAGVPADKGYVRKMEQEIAASTASESIHYIGRVPQADVFQWLIDSRLNIFASTCETNSLVLAELLTAGRPIVSSNVQPMPEVLAEAAEYFDPENVDDLRSTILRVMGDNERLRQLAELSLIRADYMSWDQCGEAIWKAANQAALTYAKVSSA